MASNRTYIPLECLAETIAIANTLDDSGDLYYIENPDIINEWFAEIFYPALVKESKYEYCMLESAYKRMMIWKKNKYGGYCASYTGYSENLANAFIGTWLVRSMFDKKETKVVCDRFGYEHEIDVYENKLYKCPLLPDRATDRTQHFWNVYGEPYRDMCKILSEKIPLLNQNILKK